jgi:hypothetical protein
MHCSSNFNTNATCIFLICYLDLAIAQAVSRRLPRFDPRSGYVGFVVDKVELGQVSSEHFGFPCQFSFHRLLHTHHHPGLVQCPAYQVDSVSPHPTKLKKKKLVGH